VRDVLQRALPCAAATLLVGAIAGCGSSSPSALPVGTAVCARGTAPQISEMPPSPESPPPSDILPGIQSLQLSATGSAVSARFDLTDHMPLSSVEQQATGVTASVAVAIRVNSDPTRNLTINADFRNSQWQDANVFQTHSGAGNASGTVTATDVAAGAVVTATVAEAANLHLPAHFTWSACSAGIADEGGLLITEENYCPSATRASLAFPMAEAAPFSPEAG
jgi:hypothetical protein